MEVIDAFDEDPAVFRIQGFTHLMPRLTQLAEIHVYSIFAWPIVRMLRTPLPLRIGGTCSTTRTRHPHGNRHSPPTGTDVISTLSGFTGYLYQPAQSKRYVFDDANDVMCAVLRISLVQER